jgi:hypothetical protein
MATAKSGSDKQGSDKPEQDPVAEAAYQPPEQNQVPQEGPLVTDPPQPEPPAFSDEERAALKRGQRHRSDYDPRFPEE